MEMGDHQHTIPDKRPGDPPPSGFEPATAPTPPKVKLSATLKPEEPLLPPPPDGLPPKPSDADTGIDNSLHSAAVTAMRRGQPLQRGLNPDKK
jgi:hypothetical protein